jgi:hypothetical protein
MNRFRCILLAIFMITSLPSCTDVKPWQKGNLARQTMSFEPYPAEAQFRRHVYQSREGASGGYGVAIGGCGCN